MKKNISKKLANRKKNETGKINPNRCCRTQTLITMLTAATVGLPTHQLVEKTGLATEIDRRLELLKRHLPYHESDHVLNIADNLLSGGHRLQDIELLRHDDAWLDALNVLMIPAPTTAGDFLRRFDEDDILKLMETKNTIRQKIWQQQPKTFLKQAIINVDGTISPTCGKCKEGMDISYDGQWGYHTLVISLANTREPLYIINRLGNASSHLELAKWLDKSLNLVCPFF